MPYRVDYEEYLRWVSKWGSFFHPDTQCWYLFFESGDDWWLYTTGDDRSVTSFESYLESQRACALLYLKGARQEDELLHLSMQERLPRSFPLRFDIAYEREKHEPLCIEAMGKQEKERQTFCIQYPEYCSACGALGYTSQTDGNGEWYEIPCALCLAQEKCPRCAKKALVETENDENPFGEDTSTCAACGWFYEESANWVPEVPTCTCDLVRRERAQAERQGEDF